MKKPFTAAIVAALSIPNFVPAVTGNIAYAASADCGIWLCLPMGFPSGCGDAKKAFIKRIKKFKPPLPNFASCLYKGALPAGSAAYGSDMSSRSGSAAWVPSKSVCVDWGHNGHERVCVEYMQTPSMVYRDRACYVNYKESWRDPADCSRTIRYVETTQDGEKYGMSHFFDTYGNEYTPDIIK